MAISRIKTWVYEALYPADLNAEFDNQLNAINSILNVISVSDAIYWTSATTVADDATVALPKITGSKSGKGTIIVSSGSAIVSNAEFISDSDGNIIIIHAMVDNVVSNADTDDKICIGTGVANPVIIKNRLGGAMNIMIIFWYS